MGSEIQRYMPFDITYYTLRYYMYYFCRTTVYIYIYKYSMIHYNVCICVYTTNVFVIYTYTLQYDAE